MVKRELLHQLIEEVREYIDKLEKKHRLTDTEVCKILEAVKSDYEWV